MPQSNHSSGVRCALQTAGVAAALAAWFSLGAAQGAPPLAAFYAGAWGAAHNTLKEWSLPRSGEAGLPPNVRTMIALLRENRVSEFRYSEGVAHGPDEAVRQRLAEGAYPIRLAPGSRHLVLVLPEALPAHCRAVATRQEVILADCG